MSHNIIIRQLKCLEIQTPALSSVHNRLWLIIRKGTTIALPFNNHQLQITIITTPARTLKYTRSDRNELASMRHQLRGSAVSVPSRPQIRSLFSNNTNSRIIPWEPQRSSSIWWMILMTTMDKYLVKWAIRSDREARMTTTGTQCKTRVTRVFLSSRWRYCETPHSTAPVTHL